MSDAHARGAELLALLADRSRLLILAELERRDGATLGELVAALDLPMRAVGDACARLVGLGVAAREDGRFVARLDGLRDAAGGIDAANPVSALLDDYPRLRGVFSHGRIVAMPELSVHGPALAELLGRLIALDGPVDEPEINRRLSAVSPDVAALRRLLVEEHVILRDTAGTTYWPRGYQLVEV
jgi:DNA-binding transcriptional ArsR family regulator